MNAPDYDSLLVNRRPLRASALTEKLDFFRLYDKPWEEAELARPNFAFFTALDTVLSRLDHKLISMPDVRPINKGLELVWYHWPKSLELSVGETLAANFCICCQKSDYLESGTIDPLSSADLQDLIQKYASVSYVASRETVIQLFGKKSAAYSSFVEETQT